MLQIPENAKKIEVQGASVDFYQYEDNNITYYQFDSSQCAHPEPMINAMSGLRLIDNSNKALIMINSRAPMGLFPKIENEFDNKVVELDDGKFKITFSKKSDINNSNKSTNFNDVACDG